MKMKATDPIILSLATTPGLAACGGGQEAEESLAMEQSPMMESPMESRS